MGYIMKINLMIQIFQDRHIIDIYDLAHVAK